MLPYECPESLMSPMGICHRQRNVLIGQDHRPVPEGWRISLTGNRRIAGGINKSNSTTPGRFPEEESASHAVAAGTGRTHGFLKVLSDRIPRQHQNGVFIMGECVP
jgi:hypothetical protein